MFTILSLSGGGYMGLYTAAVLEKFEKEMGRPIAEAFDLIAGTSIGGVIALGLASGISASEIRETMEHRGHEIFGRKRAPQTWFGYGKAMLGNALAAKYSGEVLASVVKQILVPELTIGDLKRRILVPSVNLTKGRPQVFKTPHHPSLIRDKFLSAADVALATSAAPTFFRAHTIGNERFADGGLFANSPDQLALHEAQHFLDVPLDAIHMLSIGTTTAQFALSSAISNNLGWVGWMMNQRLISASMSSQQLVTIYMMQHRLGDRFVRVDRDQSKEQQKEMALDVASAAATQDLLGLAEASARDFLPRADLQRILERRAPSFEGVR